MLTHYTNQADGIGRTIILGLGPFFTRLRIQSTADYIFGVSLHLGSGVLFCDMWSQYLVFSFLNISFYFGFAWPKGEL